MIINWCRHIETQQIAVKSYKYKSCSSILSILCYQHLQWYHAPQVEPSRWLRFKIYKLFVKITPAMFNKFQDRGPGRKFTFFPDQCVKMWGNSKIKNPRQSNFKSSKIHFHKTLLFSFVFIFVIFSIYFCFYFCICWHSADEWCHGRTSRNRTVQKFYFDK